MSYIFLRKPSKIRKIHEWMIIWTDAVEYKSVLSCKCILKMKILLWERTDIKDILGIIFYYLFIFKLLQHFFTFESFEFFVDTFLPTKFCCTAHVITFKFIYYIITYRQYRQYSKKQNSSNLFILTIRLR